MLSGPVYASSHRLIVSPFLRKRSSLHNPCNPVLTEHKTNHVPQTPPSSQRHTHLHLQIICRPRIEGRRHRGGARLSLGARAGAWMTLSKPPLPPRSSHQHLNTYHIISLEMAGATKNFARNTNVKPPGLSQNDRDATVNITPSASSGASNYRAVFATSEKPDDAHIRKEVSRLSEDLQPMHLDNQPRE
jgi:hypothetical protein